MTDRPYFGPDDPELGTTLPIDIDDQVLPPEAEPEPPHEHYWVPAGLWTDGTPGAAPYVVFGCSCQGTAYQKVF